MKTLCLLALMSLALAGCASAPMRFPQPDAQWRTATGQLRYATLERAVIGEVVVAQRGRDDFQLDFSTGPGVPLMKLRLHGGRARAEGVLARGAWQGRPARAPRRLRPWLALAGQLDLAAASGPASVVVPETGERFVFLFGR